TDGEDHEDPARVRPEVQPEGGTRIVHERQANELAEHLTRYTRRHERLHGDPFGDDVQCDYAEQHAPEEGCIAATSACHLPRAACSRCRSAHAAARRACRTGCPCRTSGTCRKSRGFCTTSAVPGRYARGIVPP